MVFGKDQSYPFVKQIKHNLETIDIFNDDGTISEAAGLYVGLDRMDVRKQISRDLNEAGLMEKVEDYTNKVGFSERTNVAIEPKLSTQWFLSMQHFADIALAPVMETLLLSQYSSSAPSCVLRP